MVSAGLWLVILNPRSTNKMALPRFIIVVASLCCTRSMSSNELLASSTLSLTLRGGNEGPG